MNKPKTITSLLLILTIPLFLFAKEKDPFTAYLKSAPKEIKLIASQQIKTDSSAITYTQFTFQSRNGINTVYAIMGNPQSAGLHPAILFLHGGGSRAEDMQQRVKDYAQRGYVTMALDIPGICNASKTPNSAGTWKSKPGGEGPRFTVADGADSSTIADAIIGVLEAFNYLTAQPGVDPKRIGVTGFSWGGYSTTMASGLLGDRVKAAYAVFGCGFYDKGSFWKDIISKLNEHDRAIWLRYLDAGRRANNMKAAYFVEAASNDTYFWPEAVTNTLHEIKRTKNHVFNPNYNHKQPEYGSNMQRMYFDYYLEGKGLAFPAITQTNYTREKDSALNITVQLALPTGVRIKTIQVYYSTQDANWQNRKWIPIETVGNNKTYTATIPANIAKENINFYACATDDRNVVVSGEMCASR